MARRSMRALFLTGLFWTLAAQAFIYAQVGSVIQNVELPGLDGRKHPLLSNVTANVFLFVKPGQEHSLTTLQQIAKCEKTFSGKQVYWVAIFSDRFTKAEIERAVKETGLSMPAVIDKGDELYGRLGVALTPVAGITDREHKLVAYQPFTKVNYVEVIRARVRHLLKEINDQELEQTLKPPAARQGGNGEMARRHFRLAERQFQVKNLEKALENARKGVALDAASPAGPVLLGRIYMAQEKWVEALNAFEQALQLDPENPAALQGQKECAGAAGR